MKTTGIVRKIDELGRIVIPKEIRSNMKLNIGSPLEIYVEEDQIIMRKFSKLLALQEISQDCLDLIYTTYSLPCMIIDNDQVIASRGVPKSTTPPIITEENINMYTNSELNSIYNKKYIYSLPIVYQSERFGCLLVMSNDNVTIINELQLLVSFIAMQMA